MSDMLSLFRPNVTEIWCDAKSKIVPVETMVYLRFRLQFSKQNQCGFTLIVNVGSDSRKDSREAWCRSRELFVLSFRRQGLVDLGVIDHVGQQLEAERGQRTLPEFAGGLALLDEAPVLGGDGAGVHAVGEVIDRAAGDRIAFLD